MDLELADPSDMKAEAAEQSKLTLLPLVALIFYEVSGGPFGVEESVKTGGPLLAILGFLVLPFLWSVPEALVTAELSTAFPANGGYVLWITEAFGSSWGFQGGFWKWLSGVIDNALYPVLFLDYLKQSFPVFSAGPTRAVSILAVTSALTYLNYRGLTVVGYVAVGLATTSLVPFVLMGLLSVPKLKPSRWFVVNLRNVDWRGYLNNLFWNLNYWDKASTLAGEVNEPSKTFPRALFISIFVVVLAYLIPLLAGTGALELSQPSWEDGYFATVAAGIGGLWLKTWVQASSALSNMGLFEAEMSSDSFQLLGMSERGMLPKFFSDKSRYGTPVWGIAFSAFGVLLLSWMSFQEILEFLNFLYSFGMLLELAAFVKLRFSHPQLPRPYKVPFSDFGCLLLCLPPAALLVLVMCFASRTTLFVSSAIVAAGLLIQGLVHLAKAKNWLQFVVPGEVLQLDESRGLVASGGDEIAAESELRL